MRSQTASTESQQGREVKRVRNHGIIKWTVKTPTDSCREVGKTGIVGFDSVFKTCFSTNFCQINSFTDLLNEMSINVCIIVSVVIP